MTARQAGSVPASRLGERLRSLRLAAGLTQAELGQGRFSKEYVSQIELGKTRPSDEAMRWLADRLGVDALFLGSGLTTDVRVRLEALLCRAEALSASRRYAEAADAFGLAWLDITATGSVELEVRALSGEAWALAQDGSPLRAIDLLQTARELAEEPQFSDVERAELLFRLGVCRAQLSSTAMAVALFDEALALAERSGLPCDGLRIDILGWRARCRGRRHAVAARDDIEAALTLRRAAHDRRAHATVLFEAALATDRAGQWAASLAYAEQARTLYDELDGERSIGALTRELGGIERALGVPERALEHLREAVGIATEAGAHAEAAEALASLAAVQLDLGRFDEAADAARSAAGLLDGQQGFETALGQSLLVLGRALLERGRLEEAQESFEAADGVFAQMGSVTHRARVWVALGDLAERRGDDREASRLYRRAAESLQDIRF